MIRIEPFNKNDFDDLSIIMKEAFNKDSRMFLLKDGGPKGYDNGEFIRRWFMHPKATPFTIWLDEKRIGGVNLWINSNCINTLGCIFIDPYYEDMGIGSEVWQFIEERYPETIEWHTETPMFSIRNHNFYVNKCGFHVVKIENPKDYEDGSYILVKKMK